MKKIEASNCNEASTVDPKISNRVAIVRICIQFQQVQQFQKNNPKEEDRFEIEKGRA